MSSKLDQTPPVQYSNAGNTNTALSFICLKKRTLRSRMVGRKERKRQNNTKTAKNSEMGEAQRVLFHA